MMKITQQLQWMFIFLAIVFLCPSIRSESTPAAQTSTGIEGLITISPIQGGPTRIGTPDSKGLPNMEFVVQNEKGEIASFTTDGNGKFRVEVPAGHYTVSRKGGKHAIQRYGPFDVDVVAGKMTKVTWNCDSGIR